jgi:hypothetical protein
MVLGSRTRVHPGELTEVKSSAAKSARVRQIQLAPSVAIMFPGGDLSTGERLLICRFNGIDRSIVV